MPDRLSLHKLRSRYSDILCPLLTTTTRTHTHARACTLIRRTVTSPIALKTCLFDLNIGYHDNVIV